MCYINSVLSSALNRCCSDFCRLFNMSNFTGMCEISPKSEISWCVLRKKQPNKSTLGTQSDSILYASEFGSQLYLNADSSQRVRLNVSLTAQSNQKSNRMVAHLKQHSSKHVRK